MYHFLKKIFKALVPASLRRKTEPFIRARVAGVYKGDKHLCPICKSQLKKWIVNTNGYDLICPRCASIQRKRLLWLYLTKEMHIEEKKPRILDFSPSKGLSKKLEEVLGENYVPTDYEDTYAKNRYDITRVPLEDNAFDVILCYHVLEHVPDDHKAMQELFRLLKPGGILLAQVPFRQGETLEDEKINTAELRTEHYGQDDHVRFYGKDDFVIRLQTAGFTVQPTEYAREFHPKEIDALGLNPIEVIFVCKK